MRYTRFIRGHRGTEGSSARFTRGWHLRFEVPGAVTDTYDYDAFDNLINQTGSTPNNYLFAGEQYDPALGVYYNRARYLNTTTGRFWTTDTYEGDQESPQSLHKYLYAGDNPVDRYDPSGHDGDLASFSIASGVGTTVFGRVPHFSQLLGEVGEGRLRLRPCAI